MNNCKKKYKDKIDEIFGLYEKFGDQDYIGEPVSQLEHSTQCALLAEDYLESIKDDYINYNESKYHIILGVFLHDIGHLIDGDLEQMNGYGTMNHEFVGAKYLKDKGIHSITTEIVKNHINTKRYLISKDPDYYKNLSSASKETFKYQGGTMTKEEVDEYESNYLFKIHLKVREWDDKGKSVDAKLLKKISDMNPLDYYKEMAYNIYC